MKMTSHAESAMRKNRIEAANEAPMRYLNVMQSPRVEKESEITNNMC